MSTRSRRDAALAIAAAWIAFMAALLIGREITGPGSFAVAGGTAAALVTLGYAAAWRCRALYQHALQERARIAFLALALGTATGLANLGANWLIAEAHPTLRMLLAQRMRSIDLLTAVVAAPVVEEIAVRLFLMSVIAWGVSRLTDRTAVTFGIALAASALVFALMHLDRPLPQDPTLANVYRAALVAKYTLAALPLGWAFWRWGLPYAILCHAAANAAHLAFQQGVFRAG